MWVRSGYGVEIPIFENNEYEFDGMIKVQLPAYLVFLIGGKVYKEKLGTIRIRKLFGKNHFN